MRLLGSLMLAAALALTGQSSASKVQSPKSKTPAKSKSKKASSKKRAPRVPKQAQPDAQRSLEIQQALAREGYLTSTPSGKWDAATSDAFARYQKSKGRAATGKPDALSLKDLGLGYKPENQVKQ
jgi:hypothetical protein